MLPLTLILSDHLNDCTVTSQRVSNILRRTSYSLVRLMLILSRVSHCSALRDWPTRLGRRWVGGALLMASRVCVCVCVCVWSSEGVCVWSSGVCVSSEGVGVNGRIYRAYYFIKDLLHSDISRRLLDLINSQNSRQTSRNTAL